MEQKKLKIDLHVHLISHSSSNGCMVSPKLRRSLSFWLIARQLKIDTALPPYEQDELYLTRLIQSLEQSELDRAVLLSLDGVFRENGDFDESHTHLLVSNSYTASLCRRFPGKFLFGASVHPFRPNALEELEHCANLGAALVKLLPNSQGFDPANPRLKPYYRKLTELRLPLLMHTGREHALPIINQDYGRTERLRLALDEGVTVIAAHAGSIGHPHLRETFDEFLRLLPLYPNLFGDTSALTSFLRAYCLKLLVNPLALMERFGCSSHDLFERFLHGSDYPIRPTPLAFIDRLNQKDRRTIAAITSPFQQDIEIKRRLGLPDEILTRASQVLKLEA